MGTLFLFAISNPRCITGMGTSSEAMKNEHSAIPDSASSRSSGTSASAAPGTTIMEFSPLCSFTIIAAAPVAIFGISQIKSELIPSSAYSFIAISPNVSLPILVMNIISAPALRAATAWFEPFPPGPSLNEFPITVSPWRGILLVLKVRSTTKMPRIEIGLLIIISRF